MNGRVTQSHRIISNVTEISWAVSSMHQVELTIVGETNTNGWSQFVLAASAKHPSSPAHLHFDAWGLPPGTSNDVITRVEFQHRLPAGSYDVTVHSVTGSATTRINYQIGDPP